MDNEQAQRLRTFQGQVGRLVSETRGHGELSLRKLSELTGLSHRAIWKVEHGETDARLSTLFLLSEALGCSVADFTLEQPNIEEPTMTDVSIRFPAAFRENLHAEIANALVGWLRLTLTSEDALDSVMKTVGDAVLARLLIEGVANAKRREPSDGGIV